MNQTPFYFFFLIMPYLAWAYVYFFTNILESRNKIKNRNLILYTVTLFFFLIISIIKTRSETIGVNLMQLYIILTIFLLFKGSIGKKFSSYLIFELIGVTVEAIATSLYIVIRNFIPLPQIEVMDISKQSGNFDILSISILVSVMGIIFYWNVVKLLKLYFGYLNVRIFFQLIFPLIVPILAQGLIINQLNNPNFLFLVSIYWLLGIISYPLFLFGVRSLRKQGHKRLLQEQQLQIIKEQLLFSQQSEREYITLRKWNHDAENHLLSLEYLMDMRKYDDVKKYLHLTH